MKIPIHGETGEIAMRKFSPGVYIIELVTNQGKVKKKLIVE